MKEKDTYDLLILNVDVEHNINITCNESTDSSMFKESPTL